jgi:class 3 adenylate cyclase
MATLPETRYAKSGEVHIAYQVVGSGPLDLVLVPPFVSHVEAFWEDPDVARFFRRLASFSRLIVFDKRGTGLSDRDAIAPLETRMDDVRAVMDAAGSQQAALVGISEGAAMSVLFAATYPQRTRSLVLCGSTVRFIGSPDWPWAPMPDVWNQIADVMLQTWGQGLTVLGVFSPSVALDPQKQRWAGRFERLAASPGTLRRLFEINSQIDIRSVLPAIQVPTLVVHRTDDAVVSIQQGRYLAGHIANAKLCEHDGIDHVPWVGDADAVLDDIEEFLTGAHHPVDADRVLATVLFTDIAQSTERSAELGDRRWNDLLDAHDAEIHRQLNNFRGRLVKTLGDGVLATFDGPARAIRCAEAIRGSLDELGLQVRAGLHTGEIDLRGDDVAGLAVAIAQRVSGLARSGQVLVSSTVKDLVAGSGLNFMDHGEHELKGVPDRWRVYAVEP